MTAPSATFCRSFFSEVKACRYNVSTMVPGSARQYRPAVLKLVMEGKIKSNLQINEAVNYLKKLPANAVVRPFNSSET